MVKTGIPWSVPVAVDDIPDTGLHIEIDAPAATLAELAEVAAVRELQRLSAVFDVTRQGERVHVAGQVRARVGQNCVVSLEPIESEVDEPVDLTFVPVAEGGTLPEPIRAQDEPPEPLVGGTLDLGAVAAEFVILGIDPYPRKAGVEFSPPKIENEGINPFASLEALKKNPGGNRS